MARADVNNQRPQEIYSDFLDSFFKTPFGNDLAKVVNERAVSQSLRNLIKTNVGERLFQPTIGSDVMRSLFEINGAPTTTILKQYITTTIKNNEPRINLLGVTVNDVDPITIEIIIVYALINNPQPISLSIILKRVR